jgi:hypothetical protein
MRALDRLSHSAIKSADDGVGIDWSINAAMTEGASVAPLPD